MMNPLFCCNISKRFVNVRNSLSNWNRNIYLLNRNTKLNVIQSARADRIPIYVNSLKGTLLKIDLKREVRIYI